MKKLFLISVFMPMALSMLLSAKTAGTANGIKISVKEANKALELLTGGKKSWYSLPNEGKKQLIHMMAPTSLVTKEAKKSLTQKEIRAAFARYWMQKKTSKMQISDSEAKKTYEQMIEASKNIKKKMPSFEKAKDSIKMQLAQEKIIGKLMKKAIIKMK